MPAVPLNVGEERFWELPFGGANRVTCGGGAASEVKSATIGR